MSRPTARWTSSTPPSALVRAGVEDPEIEDQLSRIQDELFCVGAELATPHGARARSAVPPLDPRWTDAPGGGHRRLGGGAATARRASCLPGGTRTAAALHLARCACRRAERPRGRPGRRGAEVAPVVLAYLNRLSDFLFVAARVANHRAGRPEMLWDPRSKHEARPEVNRCRAARRSPSSPAPASGWDRPSPARSRAAATRSPPTTAPTAPRGFAAALPADLAAPDGPARLAAAFRGVASTGSTCS